MARTKIDYGIDLGTTNSAIARMENGSPRILKSDTSGEITPSCVNFNKKQNILVGSTAYGALKIDKTRALKNRKKEDSNTFLEFKRTMGTDKKEFSSNMDRWFNSEELSAEVLKKLKSLVTDEPVKSVVITAPAKFTLNQKDATMRAAKLAGVKNCELLSEPIAASMSYGLDSGKKQGYWMVYDFGGGTFDAALLKVEDGIMKVIDTEGNNYLGGKNLDEAIVDEIILPYMDENYVIKSFLIDADKKEILRSAVKFYAEETKNQLSFKQSHNILPDLGELGADDEGKEFEIDITVTDKDIEKIFSPLFQKSINICKNLLERNNLTGTNLEVLILVGGPTYSPLLRKMLKEQITEKIDTSIDPMTVVAKGAALFASTINVSEELIEQNRDRTKIQLGLGYEPTTVEMEEFVTVKILKDKTEGKIPDKIFAEIVRADKAWASGKVTIDESGEVIETKLNEGKANSFNIFVYNEQGDLLPSEPNEFTIIQGSKPGQEILNYNIGIEIKRKSDSRLVFKPAKGLEKNNSTPATGIISDLKTQKDLRPALKDDFIKIPIYQGDYGTKGSRAIFNKHVTDVIISGEDLPKLLPANSTVDITMYHDRTGNIKFSAFFHYIEYTHELERIEIVSKEPDAKWLQTEIDRAKQQLNLLRKENHNTGNPEIEKLEADINEIEKRFEQGKGDYDRKEEVLTNLRQSLIKLDEFQDAAEFPKTEEELKNVFYRLENTFKKVEGKVEEINDNAVKEAIAQFKEQIPQVIKEKNVKVAKELIDQMRGLDFALVDAAMGAQMEIQMLKEFNDEFDLHEWSDRNKAKMLINQGLSIAASTPSKQKLRPIVIELYKLLPKSDKPMFAGDDSVLTD